MDMIVIPGPASTELGIKVAKGLNTKIIQVEHRLFPDGESYIRLKGSVVGEEAIIVQTTSPPQDTRLLQLFLLARTAKDYGAERVVAVVPYLSYARQDKHFLEGEAISIDVVIRLIEASGIDELLTIDIHSPAILEKFRIPVKSLSATSIIAEYLRSMGFEGAFSISPDKGAVDLARAGGEVLGGGYDALEKVRDRRTGKVRTKEKSLPVEGRDAVVFDDMISTGGTIALAVRLLKRCGAKRVVAACTHPLLVGDAVERILGAGADEILGTDSVPGPYSAVSVAPLIVRELGERLW